MKIFCSLCLLILFNSLLNAQPWLKNLPEQKSRRELTFFDYQTAFNEYWAPFNLEKGFYLENGVKKKATGWKQFKRWEYTMEGRINPATGVFPRQTAQQVYDEFESTHRKDRSPSPANWKSMGPDNSNSGYSGIGRINCIAFHPTNNNTYWVGAAAGGLWVTYDDGSTWACLTDNNGVLAVSSIVIPPDYESSHIIYIGTGDRDSWDNRSIGVLKSTDGGQTWNSTGLGYTIFDNQMVNRILMDPVNSQILIAATTGGVYKTIDGGTTWNSQLTPVEFIDMEFHPGNPNTIYGSTKGGQIIVSTNGKTFGAPSFFDENARRIELAVSPNQPSWVYAVASNGESGLYGIYKSIDNGSTFGLVFDGNTSNLLSYASDGSEGGGQGYYDLCLAASPADANKLLVGGINTWSSVNGGVSWTLRNHWVGDQAQEVHADKHSLTYRNNGDVFETNDGGVYVSRNNGISWTDKTDGISISQMYRLGVSQTAEEDVITGLQDNGTKIHSGDIWFDRIGGDGMECLIDYTDVDIQYATLYYGQIYRTMDHWEFSDEITAWEAGDGAWVTPYIIDPVNPEILYAGYSEVWKSEDRGNNWSQLSDFNNNAGHILSMAISHSDPLVMYVAFNYLIWKTVDGGGHWENINNGLPTSDANIRYITVKHDDSNTLWVAMSGYAKPGVYRSQDGGVTWTDESAGLPPIPVHTVVENHLLMSENLYAGTDLGVYSKRGNEEWTRFSDGLPNVIVNELEIYYGPDPVNTKLRAATYGRGLWETSIPFSSTPVSTPENANICEGTSVSLTLLEFEGSIQWQSSPDGVSDWINVSVGTGATTENYTTGILDVTTYYRARIIDVTDTSYSNASRVHVIPVPDNAGTIVGDTVVCQGQLDVVFSVEPIADASIYIWELPNGVTGTSSVDSIIVDIGAGAQSGPVSVYGRNSTCEGGLSVLEIDISARPSKPVLGSLVQPTCDIATGQVKVNNLPSVGEWTLTRNPDGAVLTGSGTSITVSGLAPGSYSFMVMNQAGCVSPVSSTVVIHAHASKPPTPVVTVVGNILSSDALTGNQWYDLNGLIPGAVDQEYTASETGDYYVIVTVEGCASDTSNVVNVEITGTGNVLSDKLIKVYPNPVKDELIIEIPGNTKVLSFVMLNLLGQVVYEGDVMEKVVVKTKALFPGVYLINFESQNYWGNKSIFKD